MDRATIAELRLKERRARAILHRVKACSRATAAARAVRVDGMPSDHAIVDPVTAQIAWQWRVDVLNALKIACGSTGKIVVALRCGLQSHSQSNSFESIGRRVGLTTADARLVFLVAVRLFLRHLDMFGIPDDYAVTTTAAAVLAECAANQLGVDCPLIAA